MPRGPVLRTPTPTTAAPANKGKAVPLWLQPPVYVQLLRVRHALLPVSPTAALITTQQGFTRRSGGRPVSVFLTDGAARGGDQEGCQDRAQLWLRIRLVRSRVWA
jgi:hypothetical protein